MFGSIPFIRYVLLLLAGIFIGNTLRPSGVFPVSYLFCAVVLGAGAVLFFRGSRSLFFRGLMPLAVVLLGWFSAGLQHTRFERQLHAIGEQDYTSFLVTVTGLPEKRAGSVRYETKVERLFSPGKSVATDARALIYFRRDMGVLPSTGDRLIVSGKLRRPRQAASEYEFDQRKYLERKGIAWTGYVSSPGRVRIIPAREGSVAAAFWPAALSEKSDSLFRKYIPGDDAYGLVKAMILGRRDDISAGLNDAFVSSGTVHILSVSGLHIAIFFTVLHFLLGFLRKTKGGKYVYLGVMTGILVIYAVVTGLPASVQRATLMCIIWMVASTFSRRHVPVNTLAISAFFILLPDPAAFFDIGFQLSFLAMLGIFLWSRPLTLWNSPGRIAGHFQGLIVMSLAAQLMTLPLTTYYFNQFPTYFLVANLLAVDAAGLLIPFSFALLLSGMAAPGWLTALAGKIVGYLAAFTNYVAGLPERLPYYLLKHLHMELVQAVILLVLLGAVYALIETRKAAAVRYVAAIAVCFSVYSAATLINDRRAVFIRETGDGGAVICKTRSGLYVFENQPEDGFKTFSSYEIDRYMARYGSDTVRIVLN